MPSNDYSEGHRANGDLAILWRIVSPAFRYRWRIALALGATVLAAAFQLAIPQLLGDAVDSALLSLDDTAIDLETARDALWATAGFLFVASVLRGGFTLVHNYSGESIGHLIGYHLRLRFYGKLQELSFSFHDRVHTGDLITRGMLDIEGVRMLVNVGILRSLLLGILVVAGAAIMLSTDVVLGALSLSFVPFIAWQSAAIRFRLRALWLRLQESLAVLGRIMDENLTGIRAVRAFGAESHELRKYDDISNQALAISRERIAVRSSGVSAMTFAFFAAMGLVLWIGGLRLLNGEISVGTLTEFLAFMTILQQPVRQIGMVVNAFARASTCGGRLFTVLDLEPAIRDSKSAAPLKITDGTVEFEDVSFGYNGQADHAVLRHVSFTVERGETLGIVGPPGSGKSTIAQLLPRHYDVSGGRVSIDGQDIRDVTTRSLRGAVCVVQQDPFLFTASIENNIAYGDPWCEDEDIRDSASTAQIDHFIDALPDQYQTLVGERGVSLSGGEKQRVTIARAALLRPAVLVLDDSTAAIDAGTEQRIHWSLMADAGSRATIIVSHRLSTLRHADEIIFIEDGCVAERGTHETLIAQGGKYAALHTLQTSGPGRVAPGRAE
jgi:ATP-binding cassette subfamily B multidrug efflux pump